MKTALVVDDEPLIRELLRERLRLHFDTVFESSNGVEALEVLSQHAVDAVVSDIQMPVMDGLQFLAQARDHGYKNAFIFFTAVIASGAIPRMAPYGVHDLIEKGGMDGMERALLSGLSAPRYDRALIDLEAETRRLRRKSF